jgi:hypothetical protein
MDSTHPPFEPKDQKNDSGNHMESIHPPFKTIQVKDDKEEESIEACSPKNIRSKEPESMDHKDDKEEESIEACVRHGYP